MSTPITRQRRASDEKIRSDPDETVTSGAGRGLRKHVENMRSDEGGMVESDSKVVVGVGRAAQHRRSSPRDTIEKRPTTHRVITLPCDCRVSRGIGSNSCVGPIDNYP